MTIVILKPHTKTTKQGHGDVFFSVTLIVDRMNNCVIIDNHKEDWHDFVDANTIITKKVKLSL